MQWKTARKIPPDGCHAEKECALRYKAIEQRLDDGKARFDRLETMIWGVYATVIVAVALPQFVG
jgi:hypothetical protein